MTKILAKSCTFTDTVLNSQCTVGFSELAAAGVMMMRVMRLNSKVNGLKEAKRLCRAEDDVLCGTNHIRHSDVVFSG